MLTGVEELIQTQNTMAEVDQVSGQQTPEIVLNTQQQRAVDLVRQGSNVFLTGPAGTGKSLTLSKIVEAALDLDEDVYVTATTGVAAAQLKDAAGPVGVRTFHSWAGIGLGKYPASAHAKFIRRNKEARERIINTDLLIVDEISMLDPDFLAKVNDVVQIVRGWDPATRHIADKPFGGIQLVFTGDFGQLPPVQKQKGKPPKFLFQDPLWEKLIDETAVLSQVYRQKDQAFVDLLQRLRENTLTDDDVKTIQATSSNKLGDDKLQPTVLYCHNANVDKLNMEELQLLDGQTYRFNSIDTGFESNVKAANFSFPQSLPLKVGAQVMLLINQDTEEGLINGSRGFVSGISLDGGDDGGPVVEVTYTGGVVCSYERTLQEDKDEFDRLKASRKQFPFRLAWAMTVHKSQGMTIDLLDVDLRGAFEISQAYVAISRGVGLDRMRVRNFRRESVKISHAVMQFQNSLKRARDVATSEQPKQKIAKVL